MTAITRDSGDVLPLAARPRHNARMAKKQAEKLTPVGSQARYPRLIELRQEGGILFKGLAAAVLATGLAGCGKSTEKSLTPDGATLDTGSGQTVEVGGKGDVGSPDRSPDWNLMIIDGGPSPIPQPDTRPDTPEDVSRDLSTPDLRSPDRVIIIDGVPAILDVNRDTLPKDASDARDTAADQQGPDGALDGAGDSQGDV